MSDLLRKIVEKRGGDLYAGGNAAVIPGPHHSPQDRSLSLRLNDDNPPRVIFHSFASDPPAEIMRYLGIESGRSSATDKEEWARLKRAKEKAQRAAEEADRAFCARVWSETLPIEGSPVEAYLWSRGLIYEGGDVRFHPSAPRSKDLRTAVRAPAMVTLVRALNGAPQALHCTSIEADGSGKAFGDRARLMFGGVRGHAVHLSTPSSDRILAVGEGLETCGAYATLKGVATWACLSTSGLTNFILPGRLSKLVIAADGDRGGLAAAQQLAERARKVCDVEIDPAPDGQDWADVLVRNV